VSGEHDEGEFTDVKRLLLGMPGCQGGSCHTPVPWRGEGRPPFPRCYLGLCTHAPKFGECGYYALREPGKCNNTR
jgi:hypothetical protein